MTYDNVGVLQSATYKVEEYSYIHEKIYVNDSDTLYIRCFRQWSAVVIQKSNTENHMLR